MEFEEMFKPIKIRGLELDNRIIFPPIRTKLAENDGSINQKIIDFHLRRIDGGVGLNVLERVEVYKPSISNGVLNILSESNINKLKDLVNQVHKAGGKIGIQLWQGYSPFDMDQDLTKIFSSDYQLNDGNILKALEPNDIKNIVNSFIEGAKLAEEIGFDLIDVSASYGNTIHSFLSPAFNKRKDEYGGNFKNRIRILEEIILGIRASISKSIPIMVDLVTRDDYLDGGLIPEDIIEISNRLDILGVDIINLVRGNLQTKAKKYIVPPIDIIKSFNVDDISKIKESLDLLVVAGGRINSPEDGELILKDKKADLISIGRGLLSDPDFCIKAKKKEADKIIKCSGCNQGCYGALSDKLMPHITCSRNPMVCKEEEYRLVKAENSEKIAIIGGGVAGIAASLILDKKGHKVVLFEEDTSLGGKHRLAGNIPGQEDLKLGIDVRIKEIEEKNIDVKLETEFIDEMVVKGKFDRVIIATGSDAKGLDILGKNQENVFLFTQVLRDKLDLRGRIAVIGGGFAGLGTAEYLANKKGNKVTIIENRKDITEDLGELRKICILDRLESLGVSIKLSSEPIEIKENSLIYTRGKKKYKLPVDYVVMAVGYSANKSNNIKQYCQDREIPFYVIGDALIPRRALDAVSEAANIAINEIN